MKLRWIVAIAIGTVMIVAATRTLPAFKSDKAPLSGKDRVSYAIGMTVAMQIRAQSIEVDPDVVARAFKDALASDKTLLTSQEARAAISAVQKESKSKRTALQREKVQFRGKPAGAEGTATGLVVSFKLDPRLSGGTYGGGERWATVPSYTKVGEGKTCTLDVRVQALDPDAK